MVRRRLTRCCCAESKALGRLLRVGMTVVLLIFVFRIFLVCVSNTDVHMWGSWAKQHDPREDLVTVDELEHFETRLQCVLDELEGVVGTSEMKRLVTWLLEDYE